MPLLPDLFFASSLLRCAVLLSCRFQLLCLSPSTVTLALAKRTRCTLLLHLLPLSALSPPPPPAQIDQLQAVIADESQYAKQYRAPRISI